MFDFFSGDCGEDPITPPISAPKGEASRPRNVPPGMGETNPIMTDTLAPTTIPLLSPP